MKELLLQLQDLQMDVIGFDGYTLSTMITSDHITAYFHDNKNDKGIVADLAFAHIDYLEASTKAVSGFSDAVVEYLLNN